MAHIAAIEDLGTIVLVWLSDGEQVVFDHRPFQWMMESLGGDLSGECHVEDIDGTDCLVFEENCQCCDCQW